MKPLLLLWLCLSVRAYAQAVPFELRDGFLIVSKCTIAGLRNLVAVVDTGVTETTLDLRIAKQLSLSMRPEAASIGTRNGVVEAVSIPEIQFGPLRADRLSGIAVDLSPLTYQMGIRPDVLIGTDLLKLKKFLIDYKAKTITFGEIPSFKYTSKLLAEGRLALLNVVLDGHKLRFQIDTGFNAVLVYGGKLPASRLEEFDSHSTAFGIALRAQPAFVRELQIGDRKIKRVTAYVTDEAPSGEAGFDGLLGPKALGIQRLAMDLEAHTLSWE